MRADEGYYNRHMHFRLASSRSRNTSRYRAPAPTARRRGRSASRASWRACQRGPSSATSSARTSRDSPVTRRSATAAARGRVLDTSRPCPSCTQHGQVVGLTMHEVVTSRCGSRPAWLPRRATAASPASLVGRVSQAGLPQRLLNGPVRSMAPSVTARVMRYETTAAEVSRVTVTSVGWSRPGTSRQRSGRPGHARVAKRCQLECHVARSLSLVTLDP